MKLLNHFYQVSCPSLTHGYDATAYLIDTGEEPVLLECGTPDGYEACVANIRKLGFDPAKIGKILGTHGHYDHVEAAALFARDFGTKLWLHEADREQVEMGDSVRTTAAILYGREFPAAKVDGLLSDGDVFSWPNATVRVIHTPGHTPGGVCFRVETDGVSILVAGDTLWGGSCDKIGTDEKKWRESLDKLCAMHFDLMTFGHTGPILYGDADTRLEEARRQFAVYYNPWFKAMSDNFRY